MAGWRGEKCSSSKHAPGARESKAISAQLVDFLFFTASRDKCDPYLGE